jgi:DNA invertase Pin-like site-specific DNA recombinase
MPILAYLRISKHTQDTTHQRLAILEFAQRERHTVDHLLEVNISSRRPIEERKMDILLARLHQGDTLIVSELSRLGRSVGGDHHHGRHFAEPSVSDASLSQPSQAR